MALAPPFENRFMFVKNNENDALARPLNLYAHNREHDFVQQNHI